jgi:hypothetical protein
MKVGLILPVYYRFIDLSRFLIFESKRILSGRDSFRLAFRSKIKIREKGVWIEFGERVRGCVDGDKILLLGAERAAGGTRAPEGFLSLIGQKVEDTRNRHFLHGAGKQSVRAFTDDGGCLVIGRTKVGDEFSFAPFHAEQPAVKQKQPPRQQQGKIAPSGFNIKGMIFHQFYIFLISVPAFEKFIIQRKNKGIVPVCGSLFDNFQPFFRAGFFVDEKPLSFLLHI